MVQFKVPELSDRPWVQGLLAREDCRACEYNFVNMFLWSGAYPQRLARAGERLLVEIQGAPGLCHLFPAGGGPLIPALDAAKANAAAHGAPLTLICLTEEHRAQLEEQFPGRFTFQEDRGGYDYLYSVDKLADLPGKKLHAKRNHISRFCDAYPDWMFETVTTENIGECLDMARLWYEERTAALDGEDAGLALEREAIAAALTRLDALGLSGGLIRGNGRVLAFSLGSLTTPDCFDVHFEKAFGHIQGAYAVINREMARLVRETYPRVQYLNREDDLGQEGLRKAKLSYCPDVLLTKYSARET